MRRVVITGIGIVAPNGSTTDAFWNACCQGKSGISKIEAFDTEGYPTRIAGEVKNYDVRPFLKELKSLKLMGRGVRFAMGAAHGAMSDAGIADGALDPARFGVCMGSGVVPMDIGELAGPIAASLDEEQRFDLRKFGEVGPEMLPPLWLLKHLPNMLRSQARALSASSSCYGSTFAMIATVLMCYSRAFHYAVYVSAARLVSSCLAQSLSLTHSPHLSVFRPLFSSPFIRFAFVRRSLQWIRPRSDNLLPVDQDSLWFPCSPLPV